MLIDVLLAMATGVLTGVINLIPTVHITLPTVDLSGFTSTLQGFAQIVPISALGAQLGLVVALRAAMILWYALNTIWKRIPVLGHGAL